MPFKANTFLLLDRFRCSRPTPDFKKLLIADFNLWVETHFSICVRNNDVMSFFNVFDSCYVPSCHRNRIKLPDSVRDRTHIQKVTNACVNICIYFSAILSCFTSFRSRVVWMRARVRKFQFDRRSKREKRKIYIVFFFRPHLFPFFRLVNLFLDVPQLYTRFRDEIPNECFVSDGVIYIVRGIRQLITVKWIGNRRINKFEAADSVVLGCVRKKKPQQRSRTPKYVQIFVEYLLSLLE